MPPIDGPTSVSCSCLTLIIRLYTSPSTSYTVLKIDRKRFQPFEGTTDRIRYHHLVARHRFPNNVYVTLLIHLLPFQFVAISHRLGVMPFCISTAISFGR